MLDKTYIKINSNYWTSTNTGHGPLEYRNQHTYYYNQDVPFPDNKRSFLQMLAVYEAYHQELPTEILNTCHRYNTLERTHRGSEMRLSITRCARDDDEELSKHFVDIYSTGKKHRKYHATINSSNRQDRVEYTFTPKEVEYAASCAGVMNLKIIG
jgi:hypothetical protein